MGGDRVVGTFLYYVSQGWARWKQGPPDRQASHQAGAAAAHDPAGCDVHEPSSFYATTARGCFY